MAKDARASITGGASPGPAAERAINMDRSAGDYFSARSDRAENGYIAVGEDDGLPRAYRILNHERCRLMLLRISDGGRGSRRSAGNSTGRFRGSIGTATTEDRR